MLTSTLLLASSLLSTPLASPVHRRQQDSSTRLNVTDAKWDGQCFYPESDDFDLEDYLGRWYQVAGTQAEFTAGCQCIYAEYSLNANGTVAVKNGCEAGGQAITIEGTATPVPEYLGYGEDGVLRVQFPGTPEPECPGPNYIVQEFQDYDDDDDDDDDERSQGSWAIVQASNFSTLFLLSREQNPPQSQINAWLDRAARLGSNLDDVVLTNQTGCQFT